jgi:hypothetical protein
MRRSPLREDLKEPAWAVLLIDLNLLPIGVLRPRDRRGRAEGIRRTSS